MCSISPAHLILYYAFILIIQGVPFIVSLDKADLLHRKHTSADTSHYRCCDHGHRKKGTPCSCEECKIKKFLNAQFSPDFCQHILFSSILTKTMPAPDVTIALCKQTEPVTDSTQLLPSVNSRQSPTVTLLHTQFSLQGALIFVIDFLT